MNSDIEEIKSRLDITDVIGGYIRLEKAGANWRALCPFHNEKTPSFMVSAEKQIWHCFGCQKGGDVFGFVMEMEGLEFKEALKLLAEKAGVQLKKIDSRLEAKKNRTLEILELAAKFYEVQLWKGAGKEKILRYLKERGLREEAIKEFRLSYAPAGWRNIQSFLLGRGYTMQEIEKTGLLVKKTNNQQPTTNNVASGKLSVISDYYDRFRDRIMFPIADTNGKVVGFSARVAPGGDESQAKYVNTPETEVYHKSKILYGIDKAKGEIKKRNFVFLVEGNMDVIASSQAGIKNTVAVSGTALTEDQLGIIKRYADNIKMCFDMDSAGEAATKKSIKLCFAKGINVQVVELPEGKDAAELAKNNPEALQKAVSVSAPAMEYFFGKVFSKYNREKVEEKKIIVSEMLDMISSLENAIEKNHWLKKLSERLDISEAVLTDILKKVTLKIKVTGSFRPHADENFSLRKKSEILIDNLLGLMLAYPSVWEMVCQKEENSFFWKDRLFDVMAKKGAALRFDFDNLINSLEEREMARRAENIFFEKKYRLGLDNKLEEVVLENPVDEAEKCLGEIRKEIKKETLQKISEDLKEAEKNQDKEAVMFLRREFQKISQEIAG